MLGQKLKSNDNVAMPFFEIRQGDKPYGLTAQLLAVIAYPASAQISDRVAAAAHLREGCAHWLYRKHGEEAKPLINLCDAFVNQTKSRKGQRKLEPILRNRLLAGHMALHFLKGVNAVPPVSEWPGIGKLTIENVSAVVGEKNQKSDDRHVRRLFSEASPVLHLVAAWASLTAESQRASGSAPDIYELMASTHAAQTLIETANEMAVLIDQSPSLRKAQATLIRFSPRQG